MSKIENEEPILPMFHLEEKFPDAKSIFATATPSVEEIKNEALIIPDTNILLIPYDIQPKSLDDIKNTYQLIINQNRLFIPAHVAREFVKNRGEKIKNLFNSLTQKQSISLNKTNYRLLESFDGYDELLKVEEEINSKLNEYRKKLKTVLEHIRSWRWNDPVSNLYRELFKSEIIVEAEISKENLEKDLEKRVTNKISPGFKDSSKDDKGIGDVIIWNTILELGQKYKKPIIFVTGEQKTDWLLRSSNEALYPNFDLIEEYARASDGNSFHILKFSELLDLFDVSKEVVEEVEIEEIQNKYQQLENRHKPEKFYIQAETAIFNWLLNYYSAEEIEVVEHSFVDFVVQRKDGRRFGFIVKARTRPNQLRSSIKFLIERALEISDKQNLDEIAIVIVYDDEEKINFQLELPFFEKYFSERIGLIIGYLDELNMFRGRFDNFFKIRK